MKRQYEYRTPQSASIWIVIAVVCVVAIISLFSRATAIAESAQYAQNTIAHEFEQDEPVQTNDEYIYAVPTATPGALPARQLDVHTIDGINIDMQSCISVQRGTEMFIQCFNGWKPLDLGWQRYANEMEIESWIDMSSGRCYSYQDNQEVACK